MTLRAVLLFILALCSLNAAYSAPTVEGLVISWPDDGWYQVQDADTYESVCQGERSCQVDAGSYTVINLTTGQRFENIVVNESDRPITNSVTVEGAIISWPNDGWYQVQNADTYEPLCEGGRSCEVPSGKYIVLNHTTGMRYTDVVVEAPADDADWVVNGISIKGKTISVEAGSRYKVWDLNGDVFESENIVSHDPICEFLEHEPCELYSGAFLILNQTTETYTNIVINDNVTVVDDTIILPTNGWHQLQDADTYASICENVRTCKVETPGNYTAINHTTGNRIEKIELEYAAGEPPLRETLGRFSTLMDKSGYPNTLALQGVPMYIQFVKDQSYSISVGNDYRWVSIPGRLLITDQPDDLDNSGLRGGPFNGHVHENLCWFDLFDGTSLFRSFGPSEPTCMRLLTSLNEVLENL